MSQTIMSHRLRYVLLSALAAVSAQTRGSAAQDAAATNQVERILSLSLEDLLHSQVTSVSKRPEKVFDVPAAVTVISHEDIARSGVRSIPEALRLAPGMTIASMDSHTWAISARGLTDLLSDRMLVMIDGRTVYSPLFAGVFWDLQNYPFEDIDRIEVIRGPGGTLWGANAVNGVVNIITKNSKDTLGTYVSTGVGTLERGFFDVRYGAAFNPETTIRAYVSGYKRENFPGGYDDSENIQGGLHSDWQNDQNKFTLQGDYFRHEAHQRVRYGSYAAYVPNGVFPLVNVTYPSDGGNVLGRFTHTFSEESDVQLQAYYDRVNHDFLGTETRQHIVDVEWQQRFALPLNQSFMYGLGYRYLPDHVSGGINYSVDPRELNRQDFNTFVQDEIQLVPDHLRLTVGTKVEHNDFTGVELQPSARLAWLPTSRQTVWLAVSRAVQVPGRLHHDAVTSEVDPVYSMAPGPDPSFGDIPVFSAARTPQGLGTRPQELIAYELGYRVQLRDNLAVEANLFYNDYRNFLLADLRGIEFETNPYPHYLLNFNTINGGKAHTYGLETSVEWRVLDNWRLVGTYSLLEEKLDDTVATLSVFSRGRDPVQQASLRSSWDLPHDIKLDLWGRYVDELNYFPVKAYFNLDARLAWKPCKRIEVALVGRNLIEGTRVEFGSEAFLPTEVTPVPRSVYLQLTYRF